MDYDYKIQADSFTIDYLPPIPGVYVVMADCKPIYVGQSKDVRERMRQHRIKDQNGIFDYPSITVQIFDQESCENCTGLQSIPARRTVESVLIYHLRPLFNVRMLTRYLCDNQSYIVGRMSNDAVELMVKNDIFDASVECVESLF